MDDESKKLLERTLELAEENNQMLHKMRRSMRLSRLISILYWVVIIGSAIGAFYYVQPLLEPFIKAYGDASHTFQNIKNFGQPSKTQ